MAPVRPAAGPDITQNRPTRLHEAGGVRERASRAVGQGGPVVGDLKLGDLLLVAGRRVLEGQRGADQPLAVVEPVVVAEDASSHVGPRRCHVGARKRHLLDPPLADHAGEARPPARRARSPAVGPARLARAAGGATLSLISQGRRPRHVSPDGFPPARPPQSGTGDGSTSAEMISAVRWSARAPLRLHRAMTASF